MNFLFPQDIQIDGLLQEVRARQTKGHTNYYKPFSTIESSLLRAYYLSVLKFPLDGYDKPIYNQIDTLISNGYTCIVIGDYGAYIEIAEHQINKEILEQKFKGTPSRSIKYEWLITKDLAETKVYLQRQLVSYADYKVGFYYVNPEDVRIRE